MTSANFHVKFLAKYFQGRQLPGGPHSRNSHQKCKGHETNESAILQFGISKPFCEERCQGTRSSPKMFLRKIFLGDMPPVFQIIALQNFLWGHMIRMGPTQRLENGHMLSQYVSVCRMSSRYLINWDDKILEKKQFGDTSPKPLVRALR
jgi:hypothetical protein